MSLKNLTDNDVSWDIPVVLKVVNFVDRWPLEHGASSLKKSSSLDLLCSGVAGYFICIIKRGTVKVKSNLIKIKTD